MSALQTAPGRKRGIALILAAALVVAGSVAASQTTQSRELQPPSPEPVSVATSGTAYCPVVASEGQGAGVVLASGSDQPAEVVITRYDAGVPHPEPVRLLEAGTQATLPIPAEQLTQPITVDWRGGPVVAMYQQSDGTEVAAATCASEAATEWHLAGFDTSLGSVSLLHLFNPFQQDALVSLSFGTTEGRVELVIANELLVPANSSTVLNLAQFRPEAQDLAVTVSARAGRVIAQGEVTFAPPADNVEGVTGRVLVPAGAPSETVVVAEAASDAVTTSWLSLYNPAERAAAVQVQVSTPLGDASTLASETTVPAGGTTRISLDGLSALPRFGVQVTSVNGVGVVAARLSSIQDIQRTGVSLALGAPMAAESWTVAGGQPPDGTVTLYNPGSTVATASIDVVGGRPETWTAVQVPPNGLTSLSLAQATPQGPAIVSADVPVVAGVVNLRPESATAFWSATGLSGETLIGGGEALPAERDPGLSSIPAISATATPEPVGVDESGGGEGGLGPQVEPTVTTVPLPDIEPPVVPEDTAPAATPTTAEPPADSTEQPTESASPSPAPSATGEPSPGPSPLPPGQTEEGSLFGKTRRGVRVRPDRGPARP